MRAEYLTALGDGRAILWQWQSDRGHYALWVSDGTRAGTTRISQFPNMTAAAGNTLRATSSMKNGHALFVYDNGRTGWEPWVTDGTREGTHLLKNISRSGGSMQYTWGEGFTSFTPVPDQAHATPE
ncbi:MAG: hypothetical protein ACK4NW_05195 [Roseinatronobacter sp.]